MGRFTVAVYAFNRRARALNTHMHTRTSLRLRAALQSVRDVLADSAAVSMRVAGANHPFSIVVFSGTVNGREICAYLVGPLNSTTASSARMVAAAARAFHSHNQGAKE